MGRGWEGERERKKLVSVSVFVLIIIRDRFLINISMYYFRKICEDIKVIWYCFDDKDVIIKIEKLVRINLEGRFTNSS